MSHVLNEHELTNLGVSKEITDFALNYLSEDGTLSILEPATKECAKRLADLHWQYKSDTSKRVTAFGPCAYPWNRYPNK